MKKCSNHSVSEYTDYSRYIITIVLVVIFLCIDAFFVYGATQQKTPAGIAFLSVFTIITTIGLSIYAYMNFTHFTAKTAIDSEGLHCTRFGRKLKELNWEDVQEVVCAKFAFSGYTACVRERYLMFSGHKLSEKEKKNSVVLAGNINDVIVVRYSSELVTAIREFHEIEIDFAE